MSTTNPPPAKRTPVGDEAGLDDQSPFNINLPMPSFDAGSAANIQGVLNSRNSGSYEAVAVENNVAVIITASINHNDSCGNNGTKASVGTKRRTLRQVSMQENVLKMGLVKPCLKVIFYMKLSNHIHSP